MGLVAALLSIFFVANLSIAGTALWRNFRRLHNKIFALYCIAMAIWPLSVLQIISADSAELADRYIRLSSYSGTWIVVFFHLLVVSILHPTITAQQLILRSRWLIVAGTMVGVLAFTPLFLIDVEMPTNNSTNNYPSANYGPMFLVVNGYTFGSLLVAAIFYATKLKTIDGVRRTELQFSLIGLAAGIGPPIMTSLILPILVPDTNLERYGPFGTVPMNLMILYGVATRRILSVSTVIQRFVAYSLLLFYLCGVYLLTFYGTMELCAFANMDKTDDLIPHMIATLSVTLSMVPSHGLLQRFTASLFINTPTLDVREIAKRARTTFATVGSTEHFTMLFNEFVADNHIDAEYVSILLRSNNGYVQHSGGIKKQAIQTLPVDSPVVRTLIEHKSLVSMVALRRGRPEKGSMETRTQMQELGADLAVGLYFRDELIGLVLFGHRQSGTIYTDTEQDAIQIACNQLGIALENARLYAELRNSKIYNEIIVENLISGIVAVDNQGNITVVNREAKRLLSWPSGMATRGTNLDCLPEILRLELTSALQAESDTRDLETRLPRALKDPIPIRLGSTAFRGHDGEVLGALLVISDLSNLKELQAQVRRSDRLSSLGTLSAGMAHEIKNPLVTIKTFSQLLPERFQDPDFRETFSDLIGQEVARIDSIVNQLLHFSRPTKPFLKPTSVHNMLSNSLRLIQEPLKQKGMKLISHMEAKYDIIHADSDLLDQAFVNFLLNAIQAMSSDGVLTVATEVIRTSAKGSSRRKASASDDDKICIAIQDTGGGITQDSLPHIFDPFYTTKVEGTGLGLAVSHGIIQEHNGYIEVESKPDVGTTFRVYFPLHTKTTVPV